MQGTVKNWFDEKGWGFIKPDGGGSDVFVHFKGIVDQVGRRSLIAGARVEFDIGDFGRGECARIVADAAVGERKPEMSVLLAAKINDLVVLGTDSRLYDAGATRFLCDAGRKISEIAPGIFFGWAGFCQLAQIQAVTAAKLAAEGITDIRELADRLDAACSAELQADP